MEFNVGKDSGQIVLGSTAYAIQQNSESGEWRLLANNMVQATACRFGSNTHSFEVTYGHQRLSLRSGRFGGTALTIHRQDGSLLGDIRPNSLVNRKAKLHSSHPQEYFRSSC